MKEILANNLSVFFANAGIEAKRTYRGEMYEVWELSDTDYEKISNMSEEEFEKLADSENSWWRYATGSVLMFPKDNIKINNQDIIAWADSIYENKKKREYDSLLEYFCDHLGLSQPRNVCAVSVDLAKYNNMTMGELFTKYEG